MTDCSAATLQTYRSIAQGLSSFLRGLPRGGGTDRQIRKNEQCGGSGHALEFRPNVSLARLARQTPAPSGARGLHRVPHVRPGPPPRLSSRRPSSCTAKRKLRVLASVFTSTRLLMPGASLIFGPCRQNIRRSAPRFPSRRPFMLPALPSLDTLGPLFLLVTTVKTSAPCWHVLFRIRSD